MLEQLVQEIRAGGTLETGELATRLGAMPQLIEAMLEHLQRSGLIRAYASCSDNCQGCTLQDTCSNKSPAMIRLWQSQADR